MDFTAPVKHSGHVAFSPNGMLVAHSAGPRLCIRNARSLEVLRMHNCVDKVGTIDWSSDSRYVLCVLPGRDVVQVFAIDSISQVARIDEGLGGLRSARWLPSGRHILTAADFTMRGTVWSLLDKDDVKVIKQPKSDENQDLVLDFTRDTKYMALVERRDCKDFVLVVDLDSLVVVRRWELDAPSDVQKVRWSPDGCRLACMDGMFAYRVTIYALDGKLLGTLANPKAILGARSLAWSEDSRLLAVGDYDGNCRIVSHITWKDFVCLETPTTVNSPAVTVFKEEEVREAGRPLPRGKYVVATQPFAVPKRPGLSEKTTAKIGIASLGFSHDGAYLYTLDDGAPLCVWIWSMTRLQLEAVLVHQKLVRSVHWHPTQSRIGLCTGDRRFYMWSPEQCTCVDTVDPDFTVRQFSWNAEGSCLLLEDRLAFCIALPIL